MSCGKLNIWLRQPSCNVIDDCWRTDLVIKTCAGDYLVDDYPEVIQQLQDRYGDYQEISKNPYYQGETRILLRSPEEKRIKQIEIDVPPGCYIIWTRVCSRTLGNVETNKALVLVGPGDDVGVNLILDPAEHCIRYVYEPLVREALVMQIPKEDLRVALGVLLDVGRIQRNEAAENARRTIEELKEEKRGGASALVQTAEAVLDLIKPRRGK